MIETKILLDGFHVDTLQTEYPVVYSSAAGYERCALTSKVKAIVEEEGRVVVSVVPIPPTIPHKMLLINTEL
jgi:hypothetical protein